MKKLLIGLSLLALGACQTTGGTVTITPTPGYNGYGPAFIVDGIPAECRGLGPYSACISSYRRFGYYNGGYVPPMGTVQAPYGYPNHNNY